MATERLIVKNFGPIKDIDIEVKDVNVLIGTTGSGKSTVAKLLAIFRSGEFLFSPNKEKKVLTDLGIYNIDFPIQESTLIQYSYGKSFLEIANRKLSTNIDTGELWFLALQYNPPESNGFEILSKNEGFSIAIMALTSLMSSEKQNSDLEKPISNEQSGWAHRFLELNRLKGKEKQETLSELESKYSELETLKASTYFPAERMLFSMVGSSIWGLLKNDVTIASCVIDFGTTFEKARKKANSFPVDFLGVKYFYENNESLVQTGDSGKLRLETTSSGIQSTIPMMVVLESIRKERKQAFLVIEEPEANLFPTAQKKLTEYVIQVVNESKSDLFITTHSPYIITALDNLVQAHNAFLKHPEKEAEIAAIIPKEKWLDFDRVTCYYFDGGICKSTLDTELRSLGSSEIDAVSLSIAEEFEKLTDIQYL